MPSCVDGVNDCSLVVYSMGRLWRHVLFVASKRAGSPPFGCRRSAEQGILMSPPGATVKPVQKQVFVCLSVAVVSDQRWFCGPRCVDGLTRGLSPELDHGTTWETRVFCEVSRRAGRPLLRLEAGPTAWGAKDHRRERTPTTNRKEQTKNDLPLGTKSFSWYHPNLASRAAKTANATHPQTT